MIAEAPPRAVQLLKASRAARKIQGTKCARQTCVNPAKKGFVQHNYDRLPCLSCMLRDCHVHTVFTRYVHMPGAPLPARRYGLTTCMCCCTFLPVPFFPPHIAARAAVFCVSSATDLCCVRTAVRLRCARHAVKLARASVVPLLVLPTSTNAGRTLSRKESSPSPQHQHQQVSATTLRHFFRHHRRRRHHMLLVLVLRRRR